MRPTSIIYSTAVVLTALFLVLLPAAASGVAVAYAQNASRRAVFIPQWHPQSQFAGYYMAYEIGIYKKYGIDLEILDGGPSAPAVKALEEKKADFVTLQLSAAIERRAKGVKL
ncbi:MAG TPA: ABC transporter substrate-binding protein, partial [Candidatus Wallbacteria bacterium]|nr:ABC transporter substrate-binding protein [Candidatus Wallbacteria bacterium]